MMNRTEKNEKITKKIEKEKHKKENLEKKKRIVKILILVFIILSFLLYYMRFIEPKILVVKETKIENEKLPESFNGLKLVHFSDLHYKVTTEENELRNLIEKINRLKPDIVVFTGDLLDSNVTYTKEDYENLESELTKLNANIEKYYVLGEEDYKEKEQVKLIFKDANFIYLDNKSDIIYGSNNEKIQIVGLGSKEENDFQKEEALENLEQNLYTITIFHEPDRIDEVKNQNIDLVLAGHSHHNQINLPIISSLLTKDNAKTYKNSYYKINNIDFYINQGIGTDYNAKLRFMTFPTISFYRIVNN